MKKYLNKAKLYLEREETKETIKNVKERSVIAAEEAKNKATDLFKRGNAYLKQKQAEKNAQKAKEEAEAAAKQAKEPESEVTVNSKVTEVEIKTTETQSENDEQSNKSE